MSCPGVSGSVTTQSCSGSSPPPSATSSPRVGTRWTFRREACLSTVSSSLLRRCVVGALGLALVATGCSGDPSPMEPADSGSANSSDVRLGDTPTIAPGPAASLNPDQDAQTKARAMVAKLDLAEPAGQVTVP